MNYYQLRDDMLWPDRWVLGDPCDESGQEVDPWQFAEGRLLEPRGLLHLEQAHPGRELDFSHTTLNIPVGNGRVRALFERLGLMRQVQLLSAQVRGVAEPYFVLNVLGIIPCVDDQRSERVEYWKPEDGNPEAVGEYRLVEGLRIDPRKVGDSHIFRPWGWPVALIVSEHLKQALEQEGITGTRFIAV